MSATFLVTSVPVMPMPTPMFGALDGGSVVHAVAGHGDDHVAALPRLDDARLVLGLDAGVDTVVLDVGVKLFVTSCGQARRR